LLLLLACCCGAINAALLLLACQYSTAAAARALLTPLSSPPPPLLHSGGWRLAGLVGAAGKFFHRLSVQMARDVTILLKCWAGYSAARKCLAASWSADRHLCVDMRMCACASMDNRQHRERCAPCACVYTSWHAHHGMHGIATAGENTEIEPPGIR